MIPLFSKTFLYFPGCLPDVALSSIVENYKTLFYRLGLKFFSLSEHLCCGAIAYTNGYEKDFDDLLRKNNSLFKERRVKQIVTNSGVCMKTFASQYKLPVKHVSQILVRYIKKFPVKYEEEVSIYDSPLLPVYDEPRHILESVGFDVLDLPQHHHTSFLCGAEGGMIQNVPSMAERLCSPIFHLCKTKKLIVTDPLAYYHLKKYAPRHIEVLELSEVLV